MTDRRVVQMTSVHPPFDVRIYHKECRSLALAGYDVTLIAPLAEADRGRSDGIRLRAIKPPAERKQRITRTVPEVFRAAVEEDADIYHFHDPELLPIGMLLKMRGKKVIYDVHEDYPSNMRKHWIPSYLQGCASIAVRASESGFGKFCDRIVAATPKIAKNFRAEKTSIVQNFPWTTEFGSVQGEPYTDRERVVLYLGYLADVRGLREMNEAIRLVNNQFPAKLVLAGEIVSGAQKEGLSEAEHVERTGPVDRARVTELLTRARIGICVYHPTVNYYHGQPTKILEYMAAGLPVVASDFPFNRHVIESADCGVLVDPLRPDQIAAAVLALLRDPIKAERMGQRGRQAVFERFNWEQESQQLISTYASL